MILFSSRLWKMAKKLSMSNWSHLMMRKVHLILRKGILAKKVIKVMIRPKLVVSKGTKKMIKIIATTTTIIINRWWIRKGISVDLIIWETLRPWKK